MEPTSRCLVHRCSNLLLFFYFKMKKEEGNTCNGIWRLTQAPPRKRKERCSGSYRQLPYRLLAPLTWFTKKKDLTSDWLLSGFLWPNVPSSSFFFFFNVRSGIHSSGGQSLVFSFLPHPHRSHLQIQEITAGLHFLPFSFLRLWSWRWRLWDLSRDVVKRRLWKEDDARASPSFLLWAREFIIFSFISSFPFLFLERERKERLREDCLRDESSLPLTARAIFSAFPKL